MSRYAPLALLAIVAGTALLRVRLLGVPLERDEGEFAYMGQLILRGEVPYVAAANMKLPGVYYAYAAILALFGETDVAIRVGLLLVNAASIVLVYLLARKLLDAAAGLAAATAYAVLSLSESVSGFTANAEHFLVLPMLGGVLLLAGAERRTRGRVIASGLLLGLAVLMKQHGAVFLVFGAIYLSATGTTAVELALFAVASFLPYGLTCIAMRWAGAFGPFWFWTFTYARQYVSEMTLATGVGELARQAGHIFRASPGLWLLAAAALTACWWDRSARRPPLFIVPFALCSFAAVWPGLRFTDHYFILLLPAASILVGAGIAVLVRRVGGAYGMGLLLLTVAMALARERALLFSLPPAAVSRAVFGANPFPEAITIARYIREHSDPADRIAVIGSEPEIYFYARRHAATTYMYTYPMMEVQPFARRMQEDMIAQIEREQPRFMVLVNVDTSWERRPDSPPLLFDWAAKTVDERYEKVGIADMVPDGPTQFFWDAAAREAEPRSHFSVSVFRRRS